MKMKQIAVASGSADGPPWLYALGEDGVVYMFAHGLGFIPGYWSALTEEKRNSQESEKGTDPHTPHPEPTGVPAGASAGERESRIVNG